MTPYQFFDAVRSFCYATRSSVSSYGRTKTHNALVGGVKYSAHRVWLGADVLYDNGGPPDDAAEIAARLGLRIVREGDHDHLQPENWRAG